MHHFSGSQDSSLQNGEQRRDLQDCTWADVLRIHSFGSHSALSAVFAESCNSQLSWFIKSTSPSDSPTLSPSQNAAMTMRAGTVRSDGLALAQSSPERSAGASPHCTSSRMRPHRCRENSDSPLTQQQNHLVGPITTRSCGIATWFSVPSALHLADYS